MSVVLKHERWSRLLVATLRTADGQTVERDIEDHGDCAAVLPFDPIRQTALLVRQFRAAPFHAAGILSVLEAPAGRLEGDAPDLCARREALEESGVRLAELLPVGTVWTLPGLSTERAHLFLAPYAAADRIESGGGLAHEHENITVQEIPLAFLADMADRGEIAELKLFSLVQTLRLRRPELFR